MDFITVVEAYFAGDPERRLFIDEFGPHQERPLTKFVFANRDDARRAIKKLRAGHTRYQIFFRFRVQPDELKSYPAVFFAISCEYSSNEAKNQNERNSSDLFSDYATGDIYASPSARNILARIAPSVKYHKTTDTDRTGVVKLKIETNLSDPIYIPCPIDFRPDEQLPPRTDGRYVISRKDSDVILSEGLASTSRCRIGNDIRQCSPQILCSGLLFSEMSRLNGLLQPPVIILIEGSKWANDETIYDVE